MTKISYPVFKRTWVGLMHEEKNSGRKFQRVTLLLKSSIFRYFRLGFWLRLRLGLEVGLSLGSLSISFQAALPQQVRRRLRPGRGRHGSHRGESGRQATEEKVPVLRFGSTVYLLLKDTVINLHQPVLLKYQYQDYI